jgi:dihydroorotate dehydrogenase
MGDHEWAGCMLGLGYGLSTFRTRRNTPSAPWPPPHLAFVLQAPDFDHYDAENPPEVPVDFNPPAPDAIPSLVNSLGLPSESPTGWREEYRRIQAIDPQRLVGLSIAPEGRDGLAALVDLDEVIRQTLDLAPPFVEVNLITPNLTADLPVVDPAFIATLCERARAALGRSPVKLFAKIPHLPDPLLAAVFEAVAPLVDAFVFRNSVLVRPVICDKKLGHLPAFPGRPAAGLSGPCTFETTRDKVRQLVQVKKEKRFACALVAIGGVTDPTQAIELFNDGVDAVQVCTAAFFDPFLAWKMRCAFSRALPQGHIDDDRRKIPRDDIEVDSFENAVTARQQLRSRGRELSDDAFRKHWNDWMRHRPDTATDRAARIEGPRSVAEWIKVFTV